ncbi:MAG: FecR domain-containing protein [Bacteroidia bacterium]|nr:FecR domain-containing protein [Bacteroidia bacterium]
MGTNHKIDYKYLRDRMLSGELSSAEKDDLISYIQASFQDHQLDLLMREHWLGMENQEMVADEMQIQLIKNQILCKINQKINSSKKERQLFPSSWKNYLLRIAAVLFIPLLLGSVFVIYRMDKQLDQMIASTANQRVTANPGSRVHFTLPDQTEVWLNSGSVLEFPLALNLLDNRKVKLSGQGYFKVAHDSEHPFFVETDELRIKALGTSFDVSSYDNDKQISSTLEEGSIALIGLDGNEVTRIHPGQQAILDKATHKMVVRDVETSLTTSWKDGKLIFRNTSLTDVTVQLERWFNCKIHLDPRLLDSGLMYTATIQDETLGEVLKMIEISTRIKTLIKEREVYINSKN